MGAMIGPNVGISNFGCLIVRAIADEYDEGLVSKSTEETISKVENYNSRRESLNVNCVQKKSKVIIGSMDIDKWYPSTKPAPSAKNIRNMYEKSKVEFTGINYDRVSRYLGEFLTEEEVKEEGIEDLVYRRTKKVKNKVATKKISKKNTKGKKRTLNTKKEGGGQES